MEYQFFLVGRPIRNKDGTLSVYYIEEKIMLFTKLITPIIIKRRRVKYLALKSFDYKHI
jgi:hypothetical protein